jgi:hypothetical protein
MLFTVMKVGMASKAVTYLIMFKHDHKYGAFMVALPTVRIRAVL